MGSSDARAASDGLLACRGLGGVVLQKQAGGSCLNAASGNLAHESRAGGNSLHGGRDGLRLPGANAAYWDEERLLLLCFHALLDPTRFTSAWPGPCPPSVLCHPWVCTDPSSSSPMKVPSPQWWDLSRTAQPCVRETSAPCLPPFRPSSKGNPCSLAEAQAILFAGLLVAGAILSCAVDKAGPGPALAGAAQRDTRPAHPPCV